jgi:hypothetical protein
MHTVEKITKNTHTHTQVKTEELVIQYHPKKTFSSTFDHISNTNSHAHLVIRYHPKQHSLQQIWSHFKYEFVCTSCDSMHSVKFGKTRRDSVTFLHEIIVQFYVLSKNTYTWPSWRTRAEHRWCRIIIILMKDTQVCNEDLDDELHFSHAQRTIRFGRVCRQYSGLPTMLPCFQISSFC